MPQGYTAYTDRSLHKTLDLTKWCCISVSVPACMHNMPLSTLMRVL